jgi:PAS domain S-box-containing protein
LLWNGADAEGAPVSDTERRQGEPLSGRRYWTAFAALTLAYAAGAILGLRWSVVPGAGTAVWPASGVALAGLVIGGVRLWPAIVVGRLITALAVGSPQPFLADLVIAAGTTLGAVAPVVLAQRPRLLDPRLATMRDALWLTLGGGALGATISSGIGTLTLFATGTALDAALSAGLNWWFGFAVGAVVVGPFLLAWWPRLAPHFSDRQWLHLLLCLGVIAAASSIVFLRPEFPLLRSWHMFPLLLWAALAFGVRGAATSLLLVSVFAITGAAMGTGTFATSSPGPRETLLLTQQFVALSAVAMLLLAAALEERRDVEARSRLQQELADSEERARLVQRAGGIGSFDWDPISRRAVCSPEYFELYGLPAETGSLALDDWVERFVYEEDRPRVLREIEATLATGDKLESEYRIVRAEGTVRWISNLSQVYRDETGRPSRVVGAQYDITERKRHEEHQRLLIDELNHRVKNTLAIVQGIAQQTFKGVDPQARAAFEGRLAALAAAHNILTRENWEAASIRQIVDDTLAPHGSRGRGWLRVEGPDLRLPPKTAVSLALAFHELATNAVKYGALSTPDGQVNLGWRNGDGRLHLTWREEGGPPVSPPASRGFGTRMIERGLSAELGGTVSVDFRPDGLVCTIDAPVPVS